MRSHTIYSQEDICRTYRNVPDHVDTRRHIVRYSENRKDIRDIALNGLDLSAKHTALDIGCAYGFFTEKLAACMHAGADITGIDITSEGCREMFLRAVGEAGCCGHFIATHADHITTIESASFDIVAASYSLYFFPHLTGEIARILKPDGVFIAITHSQQSLREIIDLIPAAYESIRAEDLAIRRLLKMFSMENGCAVLQPYFSSIEKIPYANRLIFPHTHIQDCCEYLSNKRDLLFKEVIDHDPEELDTVMQRFFEVVRQASRQNRTMVITKNDCVFRCRRPVSGKHTV